MLQISHLFKNYNKFVAVNNLSLHIPEGDFFGFVGPNGAGKTTTIRIVCGLLPATSGNVMINRQDAFINRKQTKRLVGYVPDFFGVYENLKVKEYLEFYGSLYGLDPVTIKKLSGDLLELVNLTEKTEDYVDLLSRGMKQRLCVARALMHNPKLLILDEPSSGLDPRARVEMKELLMNLNSLGKTIIISSHILAELAEMCTSIGVMDHGQLVTAGRIEDIRNSMNKDHRIQIGISSGVEKATEILREVPNLKVQSVMEHGVIISYDADDETLNALLGRLIGAGIMVTEFHKQEENLESLFMRITEERKGVTNAIIQ